ncbi:MAG: glycosyltransferase family 39 protein [Anaerolineales bacterium]|nr:glycosyltransferase family 39 protein [Anaerolineales bacterium]
MPHLSHPPHFDEMYHALAAQGWLETGAFTLGNGIYDRAWMFTLSVAASIAMFGDSLAAARIPALAFGTLWVLGVYLWTRRHAGPLAGFLAGSCFALAPGAINLSQLVRFYTMHGLLFWLFAISVFAVTERRFDRRSGLLAIVAAATGYLALALQDTTMIGVTAIGIWLGIRHGPQWVRRARTESLAQWVVGVSLVLGIAAVAAFVLSGSASDLYIEYRSSALWAAGKRDDVTWYHDHFNRRFGAFWALFPLAVLVAIKRAGAASTFMTTLFGVAFVLHSGAGMKAERYLYYAMPAFFVLWSIALSVLLPRIFALNMGVVRSILSDLRLRAAASIGITVLMLLFATYATPVNYTIRAMLVPQHGYRPYSQPNWPAATEVLSPIADTVAVVVSASLPKALYFFGRADVALGVTELTELTPGDSKPPDFTIDPRTGRPSISQPSSIRRLMADHASGLVVVEDQQWSRDCCVTPAVAHLLETCLQEIEMPREWQLRAFRWAP